MPYQMPYTHNYGNMNDPLMKTMWGLSNRESFGGLGPNLGQPINALTGYMTGINDMRRNDASARHASTMRDQALWQRDNRVINQSVNNDASFRGGNLNTFKAEDGANVLASIPIEVEQKELLFRPEGSSYRLIQDFEYGRPHEEGGEKIEAQEGDVVIPGNMREQVLKLLQDDIVQDLAAFEAVRQKLPTGPSSTRETTPMKQTGDPYVLQPMQTQPTQQLPPPQMTPFSMDQLTTIAGGSEFTPNVDPADVAAGKEQRRDNWNALLNPNIQNQQGGTLMDFMYAYGQDNAQNANQYNQGMWGRSAEDIMYSPQNTNMYGMYQDGSKNIGMYRNGDGNVNTGRGAQNYYAGTAQGTSATPSTRKEIRKPGTTATSVKANPVADPGYIKPAEQVANYGEIKMRKDMDAWLAAGKTPEEILKAGIGTQSLMRKYLTELGKTTKYPQLTGTEFRPEVTTTTTPDTVEVVETPGTPGTPANVNQQSQTYAPIDYQGGDFDYSADYTDQSVDESKGRNQVSFGGGAKSKVRGGNIKNKTIINNYGPQDGSGGRLPISPSGARVPGLPGGGLSMVSPEYAPSQVANAEFLNYADTSDPSRRQARSATNQAASALQSVGGPAGALAASNALLQGGLQQTDINNQETARQYEIQNQNVGIENNRIGRQEQYNAAAQEGNMAARAKSEQENAARQTYNTNLGFQKAGLARQMRMDDMNYNIANDKYAMAKEQMAMNRELMPMIMEQRKMEMDLARQMLAQQGAGYQGAGFTPPGTSTAPESATPPAVTTPFSPAPPRISQGYQPPMNPNESPWMDTSESAYYLDPQTYQSLGDVPGAGKGERETIFNYKTGPNQYSSMHRPTFDEMYGGISYKPQSQWAMNPIGTFAQGTRNVPSYEMGSSYMTPTLLQYRCGTKHV